MGITWPQGFKLKHNFFTTPSKLFLCCFKWNYASKLLKDALVNLFTAAFANEYLVSNNMILQFIKIHQYTVIPNDRKS